jgi:hypothetical protein
MKTGLKPQTSADAPGIDRAARKHDYCFWDKVTPRIDDSVRIFFHFVGGRESHEHTSLWTP